MMIHYTAIELRLLVKSLESDPFYVFVCEAIEEGLDKEDVFGTLRENYPEVTLLLFNEPLKNLPLYIGGPYSKVIAWRLKRGV